MKAQHVYAALAAAFGCGVMVASATATQQAEAVKEEVTDTPVENLAPVTTAVAGSWGWLVSKVKAAVAYLKGLIKPAYNWTRDKAVAGVARVKASTAYRWTAQKLAAGWAWSKAQVKAAHGWAMGFSAYAWTTNKLQRGWYWVKTAARYTVRTIVACAVYVWQWAVYAGAWVLRKLDQGVVAGRDFWNGVKRETKLNDDGTATTTLTHKDGKVETRTAAVPAQMARPVYVSPVMEDALQQAAETIVKAVAAGLVGAGMALNPAAANTHIDDVTGPATTVVAAPAVQEAAEGSVFKFNPDAVLGGSYKQVVEFFENLHTATERFLPFNTAWGTEQNFYEGLITDPEHRATVTFKDGAPVESELRLGELAKSFDAEGNRLLIVATRLGPVVVFERSDAAGTYVYNASNELVTAGLLPPLGQSTLADLQYILGTNDGQPNLGQRIEATYQAMLNATPSA